MSEYNFRGFWSPTTEYSINDLVLYYTDATYATASLYRYKSNSPKKTCPLQGFAYPTLNNLGGTCLNFDIKQATDGSWTVYTFSGTVHSDFKLNLDYEEAVRKLSEIMVGVRTVYLSSRQLKDAVGVGWSNSPYYDLWTGPNGTSSAINSADWEVANTTDPNGSNYVLNSDWSTISNYNSILVTNPQQFNSDFLTTVSLGEYGTSSNSLSVDFNEVEGETDSDAYYISSVQNYKGNFEKGSSYEQFDIVRNPNSNRFVYAREDITPPDFFNANGDTIKIINGIIETPIEHVVNSKHVGTLRLSRRTGELGSIEINGNSHTGFITTTANTETVHISIGNVLDFNVTGSTLRSSNRKKFSVIGVSEDMLYLGLHGDNLSSEGLGESYGEYGSVMFPESYVALDPINAPEQKEPSFAGELSSGKYEFEIKRETINVNIDSTDHELWSTDEFFFDADYGSSVSFNAKNKIFDYGDGYQAVSPLGVNSLRMEMDLNFTNRSSREANCILHFLENNLGQHENDVESNGELAYDQGISGFKMGGEALFFPYRNNENLIRKFYCFDFGHEIENEDVHSVNAKIINTDCSTLNVSDQLFVTKAKAWSADKDYLQHDIVFCPDNLKYYYSWSENENRSFRPYISGEESQDPWSAGASSGIQKTTSINKHLWTREFYWSPSIPVDTTHTPAIKEHSSKASPYAQYFPDHKQNINNLEFNFTFENRSNQEAYAILHFLESHLGYMSFLFTPPAPYNRKRRFYCENWQHTYVFKNNHRINATFKQYPMGQNTPMDDDEIDQDVQLAKPAPGKLEIQKDIDFVINKPDSAAIYLKKIIKIENTGETDIEITESPANTTEFKFSKIGEYKSEIFIAAGGLIDAGNYNVSVSNQSDGSVILKNNSKEYMQDSSGRLFEVLPLSSQAKDKIIYKGIQENISDLIEENLNIAPGEIKYLEVYYAATNTIIKSQEISIEYAIESSDEISWVKYSAGFQENSTGDIISYAEWSVLDAQQQALYTAYDPTEKTYKVGNLIQYNGVVYKVHTAFNSTEVFSVDESNLTKYKHTEDIYIDAFVNKDMVDSRQTALYVNIESDSGGYESGVVDVRTAQDNLDFYKNPQGVEVYKNILYNCRTDQATLLAPELEEDFMQMLHGASDNNLSVLTDIYWDFNDQEYFKYTDYLEQNLKNKIAGLFYNAGSQASIIPGVDFDVFEWSQQNYTNSGIIVVTMPDTFAEDGNGWLASGKIGLDIIGIDQLHTKKIDSYAVEVLQGNGFKSRDLSSLVRRSREIGDLSLEDCRVVNVFLSGDFLARNPSVPALELGGPWHEEVELNLYIGNATWINGLGGVKHLADIVQENDQIPSGYGSDLFRAGCNIIGAGGGGGSAMVSEGNVYESGFPVTENENYLTPGNGEDGGGALYVNGIDENAKVKIYFLRDKPDLTTYEYYGTIKGGGGGGAGGSYTQAERRIKTRSCANFAGAGGGGAPFGEAGMFNGSNGTLSGFGLGGQAVNNDPNTKTHLSNGANGGYFGEKGGDIKDAANNVVVSGGKAGYAIKKEDSFVDIKYYYYNIDQLSIVGTVREEIYPSIVDGQESFWVSPNVSDGKEDFFEGLIVDV